MLQLIFSVVGQHAEDFRPITEGCFSDFDRLKVLPIALEAISPANVSNCYHHVDSETHAELFKRSDPEVAVPCACQQFLDQSLPLGSHSVAFLPSKRSWLLGCLLNQILPSITKEELGFREQHQDLPFRSTSRITFLCSFWTEDRVP